MGWAMGRQQNRQLVIDALTMAIEHRRPEPGLIHHFSSVTTQPVTLWALPSFLEAYETLEPR